jgi:hypothetical protein
MLDYTKKVRQRVPADRLFLWPKLADPPDSTRAFRWKVEMSAAQRTVFETIAGPTLHALGYETELTPRVRGRAKLLEAWYALGRGHRWPRLAQRLGFARGRGSR